MKRFDVLNRDTPIASHLLLEASAGTGKTFSIENLVVRLLVEGEHPLKLEQILIVTFTKLATSDLRARVRENIEQAAEALEEGNIGKFDYLAMAAVDENKRSASKRLLERALIAFDEAQIFTIHSFCYHMLAEYGMDGGSNPDPKNEGKGVAEQRYQQCVSDYFRTGLNIQSVGISHRKHAVSAERGSVDLLQKRLAEIIGKGLEIEEVPSREALWSRFKESIGRLKSEHSWSAEKLRSDLETYVPALKKVQGFDSSKVGILIDLFRKEQVDEEDFEQFAEEGPDLLKFLHVSNKKRKFPDRKAFFYPNLLEQLHAEFQLFTCKNLGIARMAYDCQKLMRRQFEEEELKSFDDLLEAMLESLKDPQFLKLVRSRYRAVIVDEFQDTDPKQWEIFQTAFPPEKQDWGHLYLVGDPKQSIYAFRQADIYTYLGAAKMIGEHNHYSLDTNYRSQPSLVRALNHLFTAPFDQGWMPLPKFGRCLPVPAVRWDQEKQERDFNDGRGALHFFTHQADKYDLAKSEEEAFFPFIVQEIQRLHGEASLPFSACALLVADRHQAARAAAYLKKWKIPSQRQRVEPISESFVVSALKELLSGIFHYRDESAFKIALGGPFLRWDYRAIQQLEEDAVYAAVLGKFKRFEEVWRTEGLSVCMEELLCSKFLDGTETVLENILRQENGAQIYADYQHLLELLLDEPRTQSEAIAFLETLKRGKGKAEEELKRRLDMDQDAVQMITIHSSKGLEYDVVFALGLVKRAQKTASAYVADGKLRFVFDPEEEGLISYQKEMDAEKMRQLYVACTRAKYRLYLPVIETKASEKLGRSSAMELFIQQFNRPLEHFLSEAQEKESISHTILNQNPSILSASEKEELPHLLLPKSVEVRAESIAISSFSSLAKKHISDLSTAPHQFDSEVRSSHTLPAGSETGTLLHTLLEEIPFSLGNQWRGPEDAISSIAPFIKGTQYEKWSTVLAEIVFHAIVSPFIDGAALKDLDPALCAFEEEFLYRHDADNYRKGFIDLLFSHRGKFYLLDWKSNWLGPAPESYAEACLDEAMSQHEYTLQAAIYSEALKKYLALVEERPFSELFGGVYYIFLRGLPTHGVKFIPPSIFSS